MARKSRGAPRNSLNVSPDMEKATESASHAQPQPPGPPGLPPPPGLSTRLLPETPLAPPPGALTSTPPGLAPEIEESTLDKPGLLPPMPPPPPPPPPPQADQMAEEIKAPSEKDRASLSSKLGPSQSKKRQTDTSLPRKRRRREKRSLLSPDNLRKILDVHVSKGGSRANTDKRAYLGALKYLPHAIFKLLENMPNPWEAEKLVRVVYHITGAISFVDEIPRVAEPVYTAQWGEMWTAMRQEKHDRANFRRMRLPPFDDDEPPVTWLDHIAPVPSPEAVPTQFKSVESTGREWNLQTAQLAEIYFAARPLLPRWLKKTEYAFDQSSFKTAKALHETVSRGPTFSGLDQTTKQDSDDAGEFDDPRRIIFRPNKIRPETRVAYPYLHGGKVLKNQSDIQLAPYPRVADASVVPPPQPWIKADRSIEPFTEYSKSDKGAVKKLDGVPFFTSLPQLPARELRAALELWQAPGPFSRSQHHGRTRRAEDVALLKPMILKRPPHSVSTKARLSYRRLLKRVVKRNLQSKTQSPEAKKRRLIQALKSTKFFAETKIDWLEAALILCRQGYQILQLLLHKRGLHFLHLDYNLNLKPTRTLTTKERKRSRLGNSFHLLRELLKFTKIITDVHVQFRLRNIDAFELADAIQYSFSHMGQLTGIYRYKYKVMHQIGAAKDLKHIIYERFNSGGVGKGPGCGFWQPMWRIWLAWLRGTLPLLQRWLGNLVTRQFEGRSSKALPHRTSRQRIDSQFDLELRAAVLRDILDMMPESLRQSRTRVILQHLAEAWRCWKANIPWEVPGMPPAVTAMIERYIRAKADSWMRATYIARARLDRGATVDKVAARKNLGRLTRLWLKEEQSRQSDYGRNGPWIEAEEAVAMYNATAKWLEGRGFHEKIEFPGPGYRNDTKLLTLALEGLRDEYTSSQRLNQEQREELALIEQAYDNPQECLTRIKRALLTQRVFREVSVELKDGGDHLTPFYTVDSMEKIVDAYLDHYLWHEADRHGLFPNWVKPSDDEIPPALVHKWCLGISNLADAWDTRRDEVLVHLQFTIDKFVERADLTLLNKLLRLVVDPTLADYMTARLNSVLSYKDMSHVNQVGILKGVLWSSFVVQYYGLCIDILLLGSNRASEMAAEMPQFAKWASRGIQRAHPIRLYCRFFDKVWMVARMTRDEAAELASAASSLVDDEEYQTYPTAKSWPPDMRMRLVRRDMSVGRGLFAEIQGRVPASIASISWQKSLVSVYSVDNVALTFSMCGFDVRLAPRSRLEEAPPVESAWQLLDDLSGDRIAVAALRASKSEVDRFYHSVRQILMSSAATAFTRIAKRWNTQLTALVVYFREAAVGTPELFDVIVKCETRIQNKIKMGLNSKMPSRFPPCVFYSPEELGGLGMLSASHVLIPASDRRFASGNEVTHFRTGLSENGIGDALIPNLFRYVQSWESEFADSERVWAEYAQKRAEALEDGRRMGLDEMEDLWDRGLPRINTLFQKERQTLSYDRGYRARSLYQSMHSNRRSNPFAWVNSRHDGRLWNISSYRTDMIQALGGIDAILEHTLFKGTGFESWEGLFWDRGGGLEDQLAGRKLTNAQRTGLSQIPNRRFTLWWSPTINRANVYVGFLVQLDLTGIFLHGKIPTLKISYIQVFRAHLWQKIHESLVVDLCQVLDREMDALQIDEVIKESIHPRKSYRMTFSTADISITSSYKWPVSAPSLVGAPPVGDSMDFATADKFWIDVQLRYGDFDSHDITRYTRAKFLDYTTDGLSLYPSATGVMICIDLAYNTWDAYGNWIPGLKLLVREAMNKIMRVNPALFVLRERLRKALQLHVAAPIQPRLTSGNFIDLFGGDDASVLLVDDSIVYRVTTHLTAEGNYAPRPVNGAVVIVDPRKGQLYLKVLHKSVWAGEKRRTALGKWKAAEEVASLLRSLPRERLPKQLIISSRGLIDPLEVHMLDFPNIAVRQSELILPFKSLMSVPSVSSYIDDATESKMAVFNLFDDWTDTAIEPATAFSRLMLILRSLAVAPDRAKLLLREGVTKAGHLWPSLSRADWITLENDLSDAVLSDYTKRSGVNPQALTQTEIRDIILGQPIKTPSQERQDALIKAVEEQPKAGEGVGPTAQEHRAQNVRGDEMVVVTTSQYEQQKFSSRATWRQRMLASSTLHKRARNLWIEPEVELDDTVTTYVLSRNLLRQFIASADVRVQVGALLYGRTSTDNSMVKELCAMAVMPQLGTPNNVSLAPDPDALDDDLELLGIVHTQTQDRLGVSPQDLAFFSQRGWKDGMLALTLTISGGSVSVTGWLPTSTGIEWGAKNRDLISSEPQNYDASEFAKIAQMILSPRLKGFMFVPQDDIWNHAFIGALWDPRAQAYLKVGRPLPFYHELHRPVHFLSFNKVSEDGTEVDLENFLI